jgi:hypothetical protein
MLGIDDSFNMSLDQETMIHIHISAWEEFFGFICRRGVNYLGKIIKA